MAQIPEHFVLHTYPLAADITESYQDTRLPDTPNPSYGVRKPIMLLKI